MPRRPLALLIFCACPGDVVQATDPQPASSSGADTPGNSEGGVTEGGSSKDTTTANLESGPPDADTTGEASTSSSSGASTSSTSGGSPSTSSTSGEDSSEVGEPTLCGNAAIDEGELCDDGDADETDECLADCTLGPGNAGTPVPLPPIGEGQFAVCLTAIPGAEVPAGKHALVYAMHGFGFLPDEYATRVEQILLPEGAPAEWTWSGGDDEYARIPYEAITAANGDVIVAGELSQEQVHPDAGGDLWLARYEPGGALVWSIDYPEMSGFHGATADLALSASGDIVIAGNHNGYSVGDIGVVRVFDGLGQVRWMFEEPDLDPSPWTHYSGVAVDPAGHVYVAGGRQELTENDGFVDQRWFLRSFTADGTPLLAEEHWAPDMDVSAGDIEFVDGHLVVSTVRFASDLDPFNNGVGVTWLVALATDGDVLWEQEWAAPAPWSTGVGLLVPAPGGGVFVALSAVVGEHYASALVRHGSDGEVVWGKLVPQPFVYDATRGGDGNLYVLHRNAIVGYAP